MSILYIVSQAVRRAKSNDLSITTTNPGIPAIIATTILGMSMSPAAIMIAELKLAKIESHKKKWASLKSQPSYFFLLRISFNNSSLKALDGCKLSFMAEKFGG